MTTIGVFDSGFGGLTVLRALLPRVPGAHYIYLGDTARLPYGAKSQATIARYAVESAKFLESRGCQMLVIACNTATALALDDIRRAVRVPVLGVIEPGARAAQLALPQHTGEVLVLATTATVSSHAYRAACHALGLRATEFAAPLLVPLVEEGWTNHPVTGEVLRIYLTEALSLCTPQAVLLGCTHYPLIAPAIQQTLRSLGSQALVIDSAEATAAAVAHSLSHTDPHLSHLEPQISNHESRIPNPESRIPNLAPATFTCYATDSTEKFQRLGSHFLGQQIPQVHLLDLGG
jgi:glutamate racemase